MASDKTLYTHSALIWEVVKDVLMAQNCGYSSTKTMLLLSRDLTQARGLFQGSAGHLRQPSVFDTVTVSVRVTKASCRKQMFFFLTSRRASTSFAIQFLRQTPHLLESTTLILFLTDCVASGLSLEIAVVPFVP
jgi:hypothetical protein